MEEYIKPGYQPKKSNEENSADRQPPTGGTSMQDEMENNKGIISSEELIYALNSVTWYNGLAEIIVKWKDPSYFENDCYGDLSWNLETFNSYDMQTRAQLQVIWMICVSLFGDYGTSPRSGWIEQKEDFYRFIDDITETYRDHVERQKEYSE